MGYALVSNAANTCTGGGWCGLSIIAEGVATGFVIGAISASAIDIGLLAHEQPSKPPQTSFALAPMIDPKHNMAGMSLQGTW